MWDEIPADLWEWISNLTHVLLGMLLLIHAGINVILPVHSQPVLDLITISLLLVLFGIGYKCQTYLVQPDVLNSWRSSLSNDRIKELGVVIRQAGCSIQPNNA